jgi:hypothetical protein
MRHLPLFSIALLLAFASLLWRGDELSVSTELQPMGIAIGTWLYRADDVGTATHKSDKWMGVETCGWSANRAFMACSVTVNDPTKTVKSLSINTYNCTDKSYWHYETIDSGSGGAGPFIAHMTIVGNVWTMYGNLNKKAYRVTHRYLSTSRVVVQIETSGDSIHWVTVAQEEGLKQPVIGMVDLLPPA